MQSFNGFFCLLYSKGVIRFAHQCILSDCSKYEPLGQSILYIIRTHRNMLILIAIALLLKISPEQILKRFPLIFVKLRFQNWHYALIDICRFTSLLFM